MKVVHVGPPLEHVGGPAGYLLQLRNAAVAHGKSVHDVCFPPDAPQRSKTTGASPLRRQLGRAKRALLGSPRRFRPSRVDMERKGGPVEELYRRSRRVSSARTLETLRDSDSHRGADVLFLHDVCGVEPLLGVRERAEIWLMVHSPIPMGLYVAWNWGLPEASWRELTLLPDVQVAIEEELEAWRCVDRLIFPCVEALEELVRVDARFADVQTPRDFVLSGSNVSVSASSTRTRNDWKLPDEEVVGLFLGNGLAYRGMDILVEAVEELPSRRELPGVIAVAGPDSESLPTHPRLVALGRVDDVGSLFHSVDFLVNTNRLSLFDLSNIEGAAAGKALLLHEVGGNKTLRDLGAGCQMFGDSSPRSLAAALTTMFTTSRAELERLGQSSRECYQSHLSAEKMWERHLNLYDEADARVSKGSPKEGSERVHPALSLDE